jgi:hypothetical protein
MPPAFRVAQHLRLSIERWLKTKVPDLDWDRALYRQLIVNYMSLLFAMRVLLYMTAPRGLLVGAT